MSLRQIVVAFGTRASEAAIRRRLTHVWLTTGAVPVAHMVAESDDVDVPALRLQPALRVWQPRSVGRRLRQC